MSDNNVFSVRIVTKDDFVYETRHETPNDLDAQFRRVLDELDLTEAKGHQISDSDIVSVSVKRIK